MKIDGKNRIHLFSHDKQLISDSFDNSDEKLSKLLSASKKAGLKVNSSKTQFMTNLEPMQTGRNWRSMVTSSQLTYYKYFGHGIKIG